MTMVRKGATSPTRCLASSIERVIAFALRSASTHTPAATTRSSGPTWIVRSSRTPEMPSVLAIASRISATTPTAAASPTRRLWVSRLTTSPIAMRRMPMAIEASPSQAPSPVIALKVTPNAAIATPMIAPRSSRKTTISSGAFVSRRRRFQVSSPLAPPQARTVVLSDQPSSIAARARTPNAQRGSTICSPAIRWLTPSRTDSTPPIQKTVSETTKAYRNRYRAWPKG